MQNVTSRPAEIPSLTGLRFTAAFSVALAHAAATSLNVDPTSHFAIVRHWLTTSAGFGMSLFFVLSGFVIHYNYSTKVYQSGIRGLAEFFWARFSRLYPLYIGALLIELAFSTTIYNRVQIGRFDENIAALPEYLTLTQSWIYGTVAGRSLVYAFGSVIPVTWSISTEWFFYLCYPAIVVVLQRITNLKTAAGAVFAWSIVWTFAMLTAYAWSPNMEVWAIGQFGDIARGGTDDSFVRWALYFSPYARVGEFVLGCLLAQLHIYLRQYKVGPREAAIAPVLSIASIALIVLVLYLMYSIGGTSWIRRLSNNFGLAVPTGLLILCAVRYQDHALKILSSKLFVRLGEASYSIYIIHFFVYMPAIARAPMPMSGGYVQDAFLLLRMGFMLALVLLLAMGTYTFLEAPARNWLRSVSFKFLPKSFVVVSALAPICLALLVFPAYLFAENARSARNANSPNIRIVSATYGLNCGAPRGNVTRQVGNVCNGNEVCRYAVHVGALGDTAPKCGKNFVVEYLCPTTSDSKSVELPGEAGFGSVAELACPSAPPK